MAYFPDLSEYEYGEPFVREGTKNVGWLAKGHEFGTAVPSAELLEKLWNYCKVSVAEYRGVHECEFCNLEAESAERNGERLLLGTSELRVFSGSGAVYAAPTLVYHYVAAHQYAPPDEFVRCVLEEPGPPDRAYFDRLERLGLRWRATPAPQGERFRLGDPRT